MRERGLKRETIVKSEYAKLVALHARAWIETKNTFRKSVRLMSLSMRERGLKHPCPAPSPFPCTSLSMRERGLKQDQPGTGLWDVASLSMRERGLKQLVADNATDETASLSMRERGLKPDLIGHQI